MKGMTGHTVGAVLGILTIFPVFDAVAQSTYQPTAPPSVTAELEPWYLEGEPVVHAGNIYYPAGAQIHFLPHEMVLSGSYRGVPVYVRTTIEPLSVIFIPAGRGVMQPYERRREGELAGTVGSRAPSFPVGPSGDRPYGTLLQAPAPPTSVAGSPAQVEPTLGEATPAVAGTAGIVPPAPVARPARVGREPGPRDGIFVEFQGARWFSAGAAPLVQREELTRIGDHRGAPVYRRAGDAAIYIPIGRDPGAPLARYEQRPRR